MSDRKPSRVDWTIAALLAAGVLLVYAQAIRFEFVNFDDDQYVFENPHVTSGVTWANIGWAITTGDASNWHPLTWLSHQLDFELFGTAAGGHHATSVILHAATACLLYVALVRLSGLRWPSAVVAGLFAIHPLRAESVAWVSERKDVLSGFFFWLTVLCYERYARNRSLGRYCLVAAVLSLGLMAKPMLVTTPFLLLLLDFWPLAQVRSLRMFKSLAAEKLPLLAICIGSSIITFLVQSAGRAVSQVSAISLSHRVSNAIVSYAEYIHDTIWPADLACFYPHPYSYPAGGISAPMLVSSLVILITVTSIAVVKRCQMPWVLVGWCWYLGMLIPVIGLVQVGSQSHADRYTYLPTVGLLIAVVFTLHTLAERRAAFRQMITVAAVVAVLGFGIRAYRQVGVWRDTETLMRHAIAVVPNNYAAHNNLGHALDRRGDANGAEMQYREVLRIKPDDAIASHNLAVRLAARGEVAQAKSLYRDAIRRDPSYAPAYVQLGNLYAREGRTADAVMLYKQAIHRNPSMPEAYHNYATTLAASGLMSDALENWMRAIELNPSYADARSGYGVALIMVGRTQEGIEQLKRANELDPTRVDSRVRLAWTLATHPQPEFRDPQLALELVQGARQLSLDPDATLLDTLAAAQAANGQFSAAAQTATLAAEKAGDSSLSAAILSRKKRYDSGRPYVQGEASP